MVETVLAVDAEFFQDGNALSSGEAMVLQAQGSYLLASFEGRLLMDSETAYDQLDDLFASHNYLALFREKEGKHVVHVMNGRIDPPPRPWWPNLLLFIATLFSLLYVGAVMAINEVAASNSALAQSLADNLLLNLWRGLPYALSLMLILGSHELGHYFAARRHKLAVTLPYFIPYPPLFGPSPFGTFGAFIQLRQPMRNRKVLMDVGAAGPLAGMVFAVPVLLIGLHTSQVGPLSPGIMEGNSVLYALAKILTFGHFLPDGRFDVFVNQLAWAGWTGLFVTGLNLIPIGQLDGGHVLYSLIGEHARRLYYPIMIAFVALILLAANGLWLMFILLLFLGRIYATPLDGITRLDSRRQIIAAFTLIVFFLVFVPTPLTINTGSGDNSTFFGVANPFLVGALMVFGAQTARRWLPW
jgi:membrane-associated protease RseP (regulator of RpoE activity)